MERLFRGIRDTHGNLEAHKLNTFVQELLQTNYRGTDQGVFNHYFEELITIAKAYQSEIVAEQYPTSRGLALILIEAASTSSIRDKLLDRLPSLPRCILAIPTLWAVPFKSLESISLLQRLMYTPSSLQIIGIVQQEINEVAFRLIEGVQDSSNTADLPPILGLFAVLCRQSGELRVAVKSKTHVKRFYKSLIRFLSSEDLDVVVYSLSALINLLLNDDLGEKFFNQQNVHQTFELVFNLIERCLSNQQQLDWIFFHCLDLFIDLLSSKDVHHPLYYSKRLPKTLQLLAQAVATVSASAVLAKLFELLAAFCSISVQSEGNTHSLRRQVVDVLYSSPHVLEKLVIEWGCNADVDMWFQLHHRNLVDCVCTEAEVRPDILIRLDTVGSELYARMSNHKFKNAHANTVAMLEILCSHPKLCTSLIQSGSTAWDILRLVGHALENNNFALAVVSLNLLRHFNVAHDDLNALLSSSAMPVCVSQALLSQNFGVIVAGLSIVKHLPCDHIKISTNLFNQSKQTRTYNSGNNNDTTLFGSTQTTQSRRSDPTHQHYPSTMSSTSVSSSSSHMETGKDSNENVSRLMQGLQIKDAKTSELLAIYEAKFSDMEAKEGRMLGLVDAKSAALKQSDSLLDEYRVKQQQMNRQFETLRHMLQDAENRVEQANSESMSHQQRAKEHNNTNVTLSGQIKEMEHRITGLCEEVVKYKALQQDFSELRELDTQLKQQLEETSELTTQMERRIHSLEEELSAAGAVCNNLTASVQEAELLAHNRLDKIQNVESELEQCRTNLDLANNETHIARQTIAEATSIIELKDGEIEALRSELLEATCELDKHQKIAQMIHNLSGGKQ
eukprot:m.100524 g.100524  ORF g.100524 m.100524 type:complete len:846 (+) comp27251_c1_seq1:167-2704(+)